MDEEKNVGEELYTDAAEVEAELPEPPTAEDRPIDLIHELFGLVKDLHVRDTTWRSEDPARLTALGNRIKALREKP